MESTRGIGAGAAPDTFELVCYVIGDIRHLRALCGQMEDVEIVFSLHVDLFTITVKGRSNRMVHVAATCVQESWDYFTKRLGLSFAVKKMFFVASHDELTRKVAGRLKVLDEVVQNEVRRLGVDYSLSANKKRKLMVAKSRAFRHKARWTLLRSFKKVARGPLIFQAGLLPGTLYGADCYRPDKKFLRKLQAQ